MSRVYINAARCVEYLRGIGIAVSETDASAWVATEKDERARRRANRAELKRSCGHFRRHTTAIHHDGGLTHVKTCSDCGHALSYSGASIPPTPEETERP